MKQTIEIIVCFNCGLQVQPANWAACGWAHTVSQSVMCFPRDATPMKIQVEIELGRDALQKETKG